MRAMRAALLSVRSVRALPVLARAPSRLVSTEAAAEGSTAPKSPLAGYVDAMMPFATFIGLVTAVGGIGTLFHSRMTKLEADMAGTAGKLEERVAGAEKSLQERVTGILKEVDAKNTGTKDAVTKEVDAKNAGSEKVVDAKIIAFEKAADLKVRFLLRARARSIYPLAHMPDPPPCSTRPSDVLVTVTVAVAVVFRRCISGIGRCAER
jgi:hypothetical protein